MILYPALDLLDGKVVRLSQGRYDQVTVYDDDPLARAQNWVSCGARWLHLVDLNGARHGTPESPEIIRSIVKSVSVPIQVGGGIRSEQTAEFYLKLGVTRIVLGSAALEDPDLFRSLCRKYPKKIALGLDAKDGWVATRGWETVSKRSAHDVLKDFLETKPACVIYTDISRDGMLTGPNFEATAKLASSTPIPVIASGGIHKLDDIIRLKKEGCAGAILGRSIYEGTLNLKEALAVCEPA